MLLEEGLAKPFCCTQIMGNTYHVSQEEEAAEKKKPYPHGRGADIGPGLRPLAPPTVTKTQVHALNTQ